MANNALANNLLPSVNDPMKDMPFAEALIPQKMNSYILFGHGDIYINPEKQSIEEYFEEESDKLAEQTYCGNCWRCNICFRRRNF